MVKKKVTKTLWHPLLGSVEHCLTSPLRRHSRLLWHLFLSFCLRILSLDANLSAPKTRVCFDESHSGIPINIERANFKENFTNFKPKSVNSIPELDNDSCEFGLKDILVYVTSFDNAHRQLRKLWQNSSII